MSETEKSTDLLETELPGSEIARGDHRDIRIRVIYACKRIGCGKIYSQVVPGKAMGTSRIDSHGLGRNDPVRLERSCAGSTVPFQGESGEAGTIVNRKGITLAPGDSAIVSHRRFIGCFLIMDDGRKTALAAYYGDRLSAILSAGGIGFILGAADKRGHCHRC